MKFRYIVVVVVLILCFFGYLSAQSVSVISYGVEDGNVFVRWKSVDTNLNFTIYRSPILISNIVSFSNNLNLLKRLGTFSVSKLKYKDGYIYFYDTSPNLGTNYYIIFVNQDNKEILEFQPEQNYSEAFLVFIPLPKVYVDFDKEVNTTIITWEQVSNVDGYLVYKLPLGFNGNLYSQKPLSSLLSNQTVFFDVIPQDNSFFYAVIPFIQGLTNYYFSSKYNSLVLNVSRDTNIIKFKDPSSLQEDSVLSREYSSLITNVVTNYITNLVVLTNTNVVYITNTVVTSGKVSLDNNMIRFEKDNIKSNYNYTNTQDNMIVLSSDDVESKFREIVSKFFSKRKYSIARNLFRALLEEVYEDDELKGRIIIYIARCEYALGNKDEAIKLLFRAKNLVPNEADFWLSRFLVNR